ncbi:hypothetical protein KR026_001606 [Drosophila bipectinata]|nr:hypothetical protein KR026_001606 [Drosophila bipectinata]
MGIKDKCKSFLCKHKPTEAQKTAAVAFMPSAGFFGLAALLTVVYYTDWKIIAGWIPLYNTKFPKPEDPKKAKK